MAYRPRPGHTDAQRNLVSNIHARGVSVAEAARRVAALAEQMRRLRLSGVAVKEGRPALEAGTDRSALPERGGEA
jgi:ethanolamine ammonia-lyase small subunit